MLRQAEIVFSHAEQRKIKLPSTVYIDFVCGYVAAHQVDNSMTWYHRSRTLGTISVPLNASSFQHLFHLLLENEDDRYLDFYLDMMDMRITAWDDHSLYAAIRILCRKKKLMEASHLIGKILRISKPFDSVSLVDMIANGYCDNYDPESVITFLKDWGFPAPTTPICNKIIFTVCQDSGSDRAWLIFKQLEALGGFYPDSSTFGNLISWSCKERKIRNAFKYMSELLSRNLKSDVNAYNALISGLFKEGMSDCTWDVFLDMAEVGIKPEMSTFRLLLAGYCRNRAFDCTKPVLKEMVGYGLMSFAPLDDSISKTFSLLGLDSLGVKIKRLDGTGVQKAEFFDSIGNGMFLDTDTDLYDQILTKILDDSLFPNFDFMLLEECKKGNTETAIKIKKKAIHRGQKLTMHTYSVLSEHLNAVSQHQDQDDNEIVLLFHEMQEFFNVMDHRTLNVLVQLLSKKGFMVKASHVLDLLFKRQFSVDYETIGDLIICSCKKRDQTRFRNYWNLAQKNGWLPRIDDFEVYSRHLCLFGMLKEVVYIFKKALQKHPDSISTILGNVVKQLCLLGSSSTAHALVEEVMDRKFILDYELFENLIKGFCKELKFIEAVSVLDVMLLTKRINISVDICLLLIPVLCRLGHIDKAMKLKHAMLQCSESHEISFLMYKHLVIELVKIGNVSKAYFQMYEMWKRGLCSDCDILNIFVDMYAKDNNSRKIQESLCFMLKMNMKMSISTFRSLIRNNCVHRRPVDCLYLRNAFSIGKSIYHSPIFNNILIFYLFQAGNCSLVEVILDEIQQHMSNIVLDDVSYNFLVYGYFKCGKSAKSVEALNSMVSRGMVPSKRSFKIVIRYLCTQFDLKGALDLSKFMECRCIKHGSVVQNSLIQNLLAHGQLEEAELLLTRLERNNMVPNNICYDILIRKLCQHGKIYMAIHLLNLMIKKGNFPSETSYNFIVNELICLEDFDQALDFHTEMQHKKLNLRVETCSALIHGLCRSGRIDDARMLLETSISSGMALSPKTVRLVVDKYYADNDLFKASNLLQRMQQHHGYLLDFEIQWSLVGNLSDANNNRNFGRNEGCFLSHLLGQSGFTHKVDDADS